MERRKQLTAYFSLLGILVLITVLHLYGARYDLGRRYVSDITATVGAAVALSRGSADELYAETYRLAREAIPPAHYERLAATAPARPEVFAGYVRYFSVKPAYPAALALLERAGVNPFDGALYVSVAAALAAAGVVLFWFTRFLPAALGVALSAAIVSSPVFYAHAYYPSPDSLSALCIILACLLLARRAFGAAALVSVLSVAVRPDDIFLAGMAAAFLAVNGRWRLGPATVAAGVAVLAAETWWFQAHGWAALFHLSFVGPVEDSAAFVSTFTLADYLAVYMQRAAAMPALNPILPGMLAIGALTLLMRTLRAGWRDPYALLAAGALACITAHWCLFPAGFPRHLFGYYVVILVALAYHFAEAFGARRRHNAMASFLSTKPRRPRARVGMGMYTAR